LFEGSTFLTDYPYALPNIVIAVLLLLVVLIGVLFLRETLERKKNEIDLGLRIGRVPVRLFQVLRGGGCSKDNAARAFKPPDAESGYSSEEDETSFNRGSGRPENRSVSQAVEARESARSSSYEETNERTTFLDQQVVLTPKRPPFKEIFTRHVVLNILVFSGLAMHTYTFDQLFSLLCSTAIPDGGLEMTPRQIGIALSCSGIMAMALQFKLFPWGHRKCGEIVCLRVVLALYCILYVVNPERSKADLL
jgi:hypothetical protein